MKFAIQHSEDIGQQELVYLNDEYSFYTGNTNQKVDMELIVNKLSLAVSDDQIIDVNGFCGLAEWMRANYKTPEYKTGILKVEHSLKSGLAYSINNDLDYEYPVYVNAQTGWVCIGDPLELGNAVEFAKNCVAVISDGGEFLSLWLKPKSLPEFEENRENKSPIKSGF